MYGHPPRRVVHHERRSPTGRLELRMTSTATSEVTVQRWTPPLWMGFLARRGTRFLVSLWVLVTASFLMIHLVPGDPVRIALGRSAPIETVEARRQALGLDQPLLTQYFGYLRGVITGDFGTSIITGLPVSDVIAVRLPATMELALFAFALIIVITVPLGTIFAVLTRGDRHPRTEVGFAAASIAVAALPTFLTATVLITVFAVGLNWLPAAGRDGLPSLVLPVVALSIGPIAVLTRILRVDMLGVLERDFIRTARAKRLPWLRIYLVHALPNACTATLTVAGLLFSGMIAGTVIVENVFAWPGLGSTIVSAIQQKDFPLVQMIVLVLGALILLTNLIVDLILALINPRSLIRGQ
ncbi:ABC transporter permease [Microbacterium sp. NPDC089695]|uniref:ABC transporter permease n=1 Tax=Microbacterium sp. NPDC089695 TaxID=3364198 RepID=UPI00380E193E